MPIFFKGRKKDLDSGDLYKALEEHKSGELLVLSERFWKQRHCSNSSLVQTNV